MEQKKLTLQRVYAIGLPEQENFYLKKNLEHSSLGLMIVEQQKNRREDAVETLRFHRVSDLVISGEKEVLDYAKAQGVAVLGYQSPGTTYVKADMVVEGCEEVEEEFLTRVFERHHGIPWTILKTKRCVVRELALSDIDALFSLYKDKRMTEFMEDLYPYEEEVEYQKAYIENMYRFYGYGMWLVFEKSTGELIGRAGIEHREELNGEMELGYAIGVPYQRKGYATEVCTAIIRYAAENLEVEKLNCLIEPGNTPSIRLAEKLGFTFFSRINLGGKEMEKYVCQCIKR